MVSERYQSDWKRKRNLEAAKNKHNYRADMEIILIFRVTSRQARSTVQFY